ncbi:MAG TPA: hypothetical protein VE978_00995, partial [Chitinophagales bacterium]|nr:hypothetical protein [Chitinophagales bacterium]
MLNTLNIKSESEILRYIGGKTKLHFAFLFSVCIFLPGVSSAQVIAGGENHSISVCSDSTARSWGRNNVGQIGDGTTTDRWTPVQVNS